MSEKGDGQNIYVMGKDGVCRSEPAYKHFPKKQTSRMRKKITNVLAFAALPFLFIFILLILPLAFIEEKEDES